MTPVNVILMETEGPGFDSQERHPSLLCFLIGPCSLSLLLGELALLAQLVERGAYIIPICLTHRNAKVVGSTPTGSIFFGESLPEKNVCFLVA